MFKLCAIFLLLGLTRVWSSPDIEIASPDQSVRDEAARILRSTYVPPPRATWEPLLAQLTPGLAAQSVATLLRLNRAERGMSAAGGGGSSNIYRLNSNWEIVIYMDDRLDKLMGAKLEESLANVWVTPPSSFTGLWTTYYVNGMKSTVSSYRNGVAFGEFVSYRPDGSKCVVQHYDEGRSVGDETGYFPSGKIMYHGCYKNYLPFGIWNWYREDGTIASTVDHSK